MSMAPIHCGRSAWRFATLPASMIDAHLDMPSPTPTPRSTRERVEREVIVEDLSFGRLVFCRERNWFEGQMDIGGHACDIFIQRSGSTDVHIGDRDDVMNARALLPRIERGFNRILHTIVASRLASNGNRADAERFRRRLQLTRVAF